MAPIMDLVPLATRGIKEESGSRAMIYLNIWIYFNLVGNTILLPLVVITFLFSKTAKRHSTLVNLCITWIFSGVFSLLLFYAGQHVRPDPSLSLCIAQASLLYGIRPMWSVAVLALVYYTIHTLREEVNQSKHIRGIPMTVMLSAPYVTQCSFTIAALMLSFVHPEKVNRNKDFPFCSLNHHQLFLATAIFTVVMCGIIVILEGSLAVVIRHNWRTRRDAGLPSELPVPLIARVLLFGVYVIIGMSVSILYVLDVRLPGDVFTATAGTVVFLIFGTQADVFLAWCFWRKSTNSSPLISEPKLNPPHPPQISSPQTPSLDAIFGSVKSERSLRWSNRLSRISSHRSSRRHSTKNFKRLHDEVNDINHPEHTIPSAKTVQETQPANLAPDPHTIKSPKVAYTRMIRKQEVEQPLPVDRLKRLESTRKRRWDDPPRPKGPRKASVSSMNTIISPSSLVVRSALTSSRPVESASSSLESSRTLGPVDMYSSRQF